MGDESTSNSVSQFGGIDGNKSYETQVVLNVYDLTPLNNYTVWFGLGIFHSGIEVHGKEYGFGAHDFPVSGVFEVEPRSCPGFIYRCSVSLGRINMHPSEFRTFIENVASEYHGDTYHLISKNCNHFTDDMACRLTQKQIPGWVNRLARLGSLCSCLLPESLQVTTVKQIPEYHHESEDGTETPPITTPRVSEELDDDQEKRLLSPLAAMSPVAGSGDVTFVKEAHK
ncbi:hypothetical protein CerSpe_263150 [Prunus speciosa]|uniref:DeSI-like protein At4g17486 isoform X2 n=1 Tax=Prunus avium TaxID=42229 RepID=A0A6P5SLL9_PRUAV|nr:deSI-like protein At4g17486 isoform X2 [Prunus avium]